MKDLMSGLKALIVLVFLIAFFFIALQFRPTIASSTSVAGAPKAAKPTNQAYPPPQQDIISTQTEANQKPSLTPPILSKANNDGLRIFLPLVMKATCQGYTALLDIASNKNTLIIGDTLSITLTLHDTGCSNLGLLYYQIQPPHIDHLEEVTPRMQIHYLSIEPNSSDTAVFLFKANSAGQVTISGQADFEVHLESGPPLNGHAETGNITITINQP